VGSGIGISHVFGPSVDGGSSAKRHGCPRRVGVQPDSLRWRIDEGLARSRFGVVVLSKNFSQRSSHGASSTRKRLVRAPASACRIVDARIHG
jgi:hypothetical protein